MTLAGHVSGDAAVKPRPQPDDEEESQTWANSCTPLDEHANLLFTARGLTLSHAANL